MHQCERCRPSQCNNAGRGTPERPQYLGWIVWSYGMLLFVLRHSELHRNHTSKRLNSNATPADEDCVIVNNGTHAARVENVA